MWKYKEEYKLDRPETIGEKDYTFDLDNYREWLEGQLTECRKQLSIANVVGQSEQLSLSDFRLGFEYEEYQMDSERYLNRGMIWVKKTYGLNSPRLHKIQKLLHEGKLRKA